jgi:hypothetical protein
VRFFAFPLIVSALAIVGALIFADPSWAFLLLTLAVLEVTLSFDNAVINALWLKRMNPFWQRMFLTVGILIAVFGMRLVFPVVVVAIAAHISIGETIRLALQDSETYARTLEGVHHEIATFGAVFLGMIFLEWLFEERDIHWLGPVERFFHKVGKVDYMSVGTMLICLLVLAPHYLMAGVVSLVTYLAISALSSYFDKKNETTQAVTAGGLGVFMYLELMDASFSFDGVMAAFAVSNDVILIALGLGIGAVYVRTMTVYLVRKGILNDLIHLEHGAHWAIGTLAALMFVSLHLELPEVLTAALSLTLIGAALFTSIRHNRQKVALHS